MVPALSRAVSMWGEAWAGRRPWLYCMKLSRAAYRWGRRASWFCPRSSTARSLLNRSSVADGTCPPAV